MIFRESARGVLKIPRHLIKRLGIQNQEYLDEVEVIIGLKKSVEWNLEDFHRDGFSTV